MSDEQPTIRPPQHAEVVRLLGDFLAAAGRPGGTSANAWADRFLDLVTRDPEAVDLRREALDQAIRHLPALAGPDSVTKAATAYAAFLQGTTVETVPRASTEGDGGAPDEVHALLDFVWSRTTTDSDGTTLSSLEGGDARREAASYLAEYGYTLLRWTQHVLTVTTNVAFLIEREHRA